MAAGGRHVVFVLLLLLFLIFSSSSLCPTAARLGQPAGSSVSHDRESSEDVPQANQTARQAVPPNDAGRAPPVHSDSLTAPECCVSLFVFCCCCKRLCLDVTVRCDFTPRHDMMLNCQPSQAQNVPSVGFLKVSTEVSYITVCSERGCIKLSGKRRKQNVTRSLRDHNQSGCIVFELLRSLIRETTHQRMTLHCHAVRERPLDPV